MNYCLILDIFMYQKKSMKICDEDLFKNNLLSSSVNEMFCPKWMNFKAIVSAISN
jgi:hypothetical protein